jgi:glucose/arabinose dehydrogenase
VSYEDFITGWQTPAGNRWGRPVDVLVYKDGSVLVSDDRGGAIYRVTH